MATTHTSDVDESVVHVDKFLKTNAARLGVVEILSGEKCRGRKIEDGDTHTPHVHTHTPHVHTHTLTREIDLYRRRKVEDGDSHTPHVHTHTLTRERNLYRRRKVEDGDSHTPHVC